MQSNILTLFVGLALSALLLPASAASLATSSAPLKTLPYNFTLAALNTTLPNVNDTGVPLVVGYDYYVHGSSGFSTSTWASAHDNVFPSLGLVHGALRAYGRDGSWDANASTIISGESMGWISGSIYGPLEHDQYTAVHTMHHSKYATLVTQGQDALWSLCPTGDYWKKNVVYYNISSPDKDSKDCYEVALQIVPVH
ncbi:uncharacterized protein SCHCODRAFT_02593280 [Schizophyllum commune H4-8]|uniref:Uncharacterized protein n=1 Tax=Schizophyllum commune (strain H4-8 / FGSC 9210) TaxID=578458 RepID=D8QJT9_SCHCM|nr:uncharacterized protein SCHCODRAFT_02593280 [Schizophyllum commune H4-8]KAI5885547.1 hypothetical protein SCHCODRAFT_02593280 [Schizophyllum commune H4-8]